MTTPDFLDAVATTTAAVCAGAAGGVYVAFSAMVIPALNARPAGEAVTAMQRINVLAVRPPFMVLFFGGAVASVVVVATAGASEPHSLMRLAGAVLSPRKLRGDRRCQCSAQQHAGPSFRCGLYGRLARF